MSANLTARFIGARIASGWTGGLGSVEEAIVDLDTSAVSDVDGTSLIDLLVAVADFDGLHFADLDGSALVEPL